MAEQLRPASFKGVPFRVRFSDSEFGRRNVLHEYPYRDLPYGEDIGRAARVFTLTARFVGPTAFDDQQALVEVCETPGPGTLIHPWRGAQFVQLEGPARVREPAAPGGAWEVEMSFREAGENTEPAARDDSEAQLGAAADAAQEAADEAFALEWLEDIAGLAEEAAAVVEGVCDTLEGYLEPFDRAMAALDRVINAVQRIINAPLALIGRIQGRIQTLIGKLDNPFSGVSAWRALMKGKTLNPWQAPGQPTTVGARPTWTQADPGRRAGELPAMPPSLATYVRRTLLVEAVRRLPTATFVAKADVQAARAQILLALDTELKAAPDALFAPLADLRVTVAASVRDRLPAAADLVTLDTRATLPALVLAYRVNGDIEAVDDLVARNGVRHPGFVPAGTLEVLKRG